MIKTVLPLILLLLPAVLSAKDFFGDPVITAPQPELFSVCYDHSCTTIVTDSLSPDEWQLATAALRQPHRTSADEREAIAAAVAVMEQIVGRHIGTSVDIGRNLRGFGRPFQMDCIDESTNSNSYLLMFERDGLLKYHTVVSRSTRFGLFVGMPHTTAVIEDNATHQRYVVDSWFHDNGQPPFIEKLEVWKAGGDPDKDSGVAGR